MLPPPACISYDVIASCNDWLNATLQYIPVQYSTVVLTQQILNGEQVRHSQQIGRPFTCCACPSLSRIDHEPIMACDRPAYKFVCLNS